MLSGFPFRITGNYFHRLNMKYVPSHPIGFMENHSIFPCQNTVFFLFNSISKIDNNVRRNTIARLNAWHLSGTIKFKVGRACYNFDARHCPTQTYFDKWMFQYMEVHRIPGVFWGQGSVTAPRIEAVIPFYIGQERDY